MSKDLEKNTVNVEEEKVRYEDSGLDEKIVNETSSTLLFISLEAISLSVIPFPQV